MSDEEKKTIRPIYLWAAGFVLMFAAWFMQSAYADIKDNTEHRHKGETEIKSIKDDVKEIKTDVKELLSRGE